MTKPSRKPRDICIGGYLVIAEPNGTGNVYDEHDSGSDCLPPDDEEPAPIEPQLESQLDRSSPRRRRLARALDCAVAGKCWGSPRRKSGDPVE